MMRHVLVGTMILASLVTVAPVTTWAASTDSNAQPDVIDRRQRKAQEQPGQAIPEEPVIEGAPTPAKAPIEEGAHFTLTRIQVTGVTRLPQRVVDALVQPYLHREITLRDLQQLANDLEQAYRSRGYFTTTVFIPPQRIEHDEATITVVEGRMGDVSIDGKLRFFSRAWLLRYWTIAQGRVLRFQELRRSVARMNEHPDHSVQALLRQGASPGTTDVVLKVKERAPYHVGVLWDNEGTKPIGRERFGVSLRHNNLLGRDDQLIGGWLFGKHFDAAYAQYQMPLNHYGTDAFASFSRSEVRPARQFAQSDIYGTSKTYAAGLEQAIVQAERVDVRARTSIEFQDNRVTQSLGTTRRDRLRIIRFEPRVRFMNLWGGWLFIENENSFGINGLGATDTNNPLAGRPGTKPNFVKVRINATRIQQMPWYTRLIVAVRTQLASRTLLPSEQLYMGGADSVRGYPEGDYLADDGIITRIDYLVPLRFLPSAWRVPSSRVPLGDQLYVGPFVDHGYGRLRSVATGENQTRNLLAVGFGMEWNVGNDLSARIDWGYHLGDDPLTDDSPSALDFSLRYQL